MPAQSRDGRRARRSLPRSRLRPQTARRPASRGARVSEYLLRRNVQPGLPDGLPAVQRRSTTSCASACSCRRSRSCRRSSRGRRCCTLESQTPVARFRRLRLLGLVRVGLHQRRLRCCGWPGFRRAPKRDRQRPAGRHRRRRDVRQSRAARAVCRRDRGRRRRSRWCRRSSRASATADRSRRPAAPPRAERGFYIPSFYDVALRRRRPHRGVRAASRAPARRRSCKKAAVKTTERLDPPATTHLHARHRVRIALPRSRSCAAAPTCAGSAGPATTTCPCARFRPIESSSSRKRRGAREPRRPGVDRALRSPRDRADPHAACSRWATRSARRRCGSTI